MATINEMIQTKVEIKKAVDQIIKANKHKLKAKKEKAEGQAVIIPVMKENGINSEKVKGLNFSYVKPGKRANFDKDLAKEMLLDWGFDAEVIELIWDVASKDSDVAESLKIS